MPAPLIDLTRPADLGAWRWLWDEIGEANRAGFLRLLKAADGPADGESPVALAMAFLRHPGIEGCHLDAYPDPETKGDPWTIGWGNTRVDGRAVRRGDRITQAQADALLVQTVQAVERVLAGDVPTWSLLNVGQQAALLSFAYNCGAWFMRQPTGFDTIQAALREGRLMDVPAAMMLYVNPGGPTEAGLRKRRRLEGAIWRGEWRPGQPEPGAAPPTPVQPPAPATAPAKEPQFYLQSDSLVAGQAPRSCFSSSCAMLLKRVKPSALAGSNADDEYLRRVLTFGDTTEWQAQIKALASYGVQSRLIQNGNWEILEQQCRRGYGAALGYIHRGPVNAPVGSGHWCYGWGLDATLLTAHDPMGEADMVGGGFVPGRSGRAVRYTRRNFSRRWEVVGPPWRHAPGHGWMIVVDGVSG